MHVQRLKDNNALSVLLISATASTPIRSTRYAKDTPKTRQGRETKHDKRESVKKEGDIFILKRNSVQPSGSHRANRNVSGIRICFWALLAACYVFCLVHFCPFSLTSHGSMHALYQSDTINDPSLFFYVSSLAPSLSEHRASPSKPTSTDCRGSSFCGRTIRKAGRPHDIHISTQLENGTEPFLDSSSQTSPEYTRTRE